MNLKGKNDDTDGDDDDDDDGKESMLMTNVTINNNDAYSVSKIFKMLMFSSSFPRFKDGVLKAEKYKSLMM